MKKVLMILLVALMILGGTLPRTAMAEGEKSPEEYGFKTLGDVLDCESPASSCYETLYIRIFEKDGVFYRAEAEITSEIFAALFEIDFFDPDKDARTKALLSDLPIRTLYVLSDALLSDAELKDLKGKSGQDLLDMGFVPQGSYGFGDGESFVYLDKGPFGYQIDFKEKDVTVTGDNPNLAEVIRSLTVKKAAFIGNLSDYATQESFDINSGRSLEDYESSFTEDQAETVFFEIPEIPVEESPFKTLADVFAAKGELYSLSTSPDKVVIVFPVDGVYYRVEADIPADVYEKMDAIDFFDETREEQEQVLLSPLPVTRVGNLSDGIPSQDELDALVGLTGQDLLDMGFAYGSGYSFWDKAEMYLVQGLYEYHVCFNERVPERENYDEALDELMPTLTVEKVEFFMPDGICSDPDLIW